MEYLQSAGHLLTICCICVIVSVKANGSTYSVISENNPNEKFKNHNMDGWTPIKPTLEYLKLNQRKNCVSIGSFNTDCNEATETATETEETLKYKSIVNLLQRDYESPYGNYVAELVPKLPSHYKNAIPQYQPNSNRRQFRRYTSTSHKRNIELPRFVDEYPTDKYRSRAFHEAVSRYRKRRRYPMFEPIPGQILYPPIVPQFISNPLNKLIRFSSRKDDDLALSGNNVNIKTFQSTIFPYYEHESITKKHSKSKEIVRNKGRFDVTPPVFSTVIEPTTIKISSTTSGTSTSSSSTTTTKGPPIQYVYSVAANEPNKNNFLNGFEKELPRKVVVESPPIKSPIYENVISTKLSNRFVEYTTPGYSVYVTIKPIIDSPERSDTMESIGEWTNEIPNSKNRVKVIPLLRYDEEQWDANDDSMDTTESSNQNRTYIANSAGFRNLGHNTKKTTLKPQIYTLSSLLLDTENQSISHQLPKPGQYVDHLSSTIINDYVGKTQRSVQPAEALPSSITMNHQPPLSNKSNNQNTTNSRWTQPHTINNNDGINGRDQKIKDINLDMVVTTTERPKSSTTTTTTTRRNQIYENKIYSGINDGDEWNDGNVDSHSRSFNGYGRVNVEPNVEWIMVSKSLMDNSKYKDVPKKSRTERLISSSYQDYIIPMRMTQMPKVNNSNMVLSTNILVQ